MSTYLVTGGLGVQGSLFSKRLMVEGHKVIIIDDGQAKRHTFNTPDGSEQHLVQINASVLREVLPQVDFVIHTAGSTGIPHSALHPVEDWDRNVNGTLTLLEALRICPKPTVILSSVKPYVSSLDGLVESGELAPDEPYAASKAAQSLMAQAWARSFDLPVTVFRCSNLYGPAACHGHLGMAWATWFAIQSVLPSPITIQGDGRQARDLLWWEDLLRAIHKAFGSIDRVKGEIFNIGGGKDRVVSINWAVGFLREFACIETKNVPGRRFEDPLVYADNAKISKALGWEPVVRPGQGLSRIYYWALKNQAALREVYDVSTKRVAGTPSRP